MLGFTIQLHCVRNVCNDTVEKRAKSPAKKRSKKRKKEREENMSVMRSTKERNFDIGVWPFTRRRAQLYRYRRDRSFLFGSTHTREEEQSHGCIGWLHRCVSEHGNISSCCFRGSCRREECDTRWDVNFSPEFWTRSHMDESDYLS